MSAYAINCDRTQSRCYGKDIRIADSVGRVAGRNIPELVAVNVHLQVEIAVVPMRSLRRRRPDSKAAGVLEADGLADVVVVALDESDLGAGWCIRVVARERTAVRAYPGLAAAPDRDERP